MVPNVPSKNRTPALAAAAAFSTKGGITAYRFTAPGVQDNQQYNAMNLRAIPGVAYYSRRFLVPALPPTTLPVDVCLHINQVTSESICETIACAAYFALRDGTGNSCRSKRG
ncbi:Hypothetical protein NTJ_03386 [Nesidiocoris tenuis]|uniref:Uncharacterized protein n=1 Tax=Nesidiocoris tenuis TaxID=355587 RepID=A0ABN7AJQ1_9HEMI|nr:Hypothetical protein NTJ_03386 [Nesidiocoris tenuis]